MWFSSWLGKRQRSAASGRIHTPPRKQPIYRLRLEVLEDRWLPSPIGLTVTSLADSGAGTLRAAILSADAGSHSDKFTIDFAVAGTIDLQSQLPGLNNNITIQGPGASSLTVERAAGISFPMGIPLVLVETGHTATISGLTVANADNGGIANANGGTLTLANCVVVNNSTTPGNFGGGVNNTGTMTISGCAFSGNSSEIGGGIFNGGTLTVTGSTLSDNFAKSPGFAISPSGGGIYNEGILTVTGNSTLFGNSAEYGGGIYNANGAKALTVSGCTLSGNTATYGGGIYNLGTLTVANNSTFSGNTATYGGGILNDQTASGTIRDSVFTANSATQGGGIYNQVGATLDVQNTTFSGNNTASDSGGAIYNLGTATVQQSTLSGNSAGSAGGGIYNAAPGTLAVKDSTVLHNLAPRGADIYNLGALTLNDSTVGVIGP